jgi:hypothetical protein
LVLSFPKEEPAGKGLVYGSLTGQAILESQKN